jgi:hypothetical protein
MMLPNAAVARTKDDPDRTEGRAPAARPPRAASAGGEGRSPQPGGVAARRHNRGVEQLHEIDIHQAILEDGGGERNRKD